MSKRKKLKAKPFAVIMAGASAVMLSVGVALPIVTTYYDQVLRDVFKEAGTSTGASNTSDLGKDLDLMYNKLDYSSVEKLEAAEKEYIRKAGAEGLVLLKNDTTSSKGLPLTTSAESKTKVSLFSHSSVDLISGGTGSGLSYGSSDLKTAFEAANYEVNEQLWNFYKDGSKNQARGEGSKFYGGSEDWSINETPIEKLQSESGLLESTEGTTAIFVLSRTGGEGRDLGRNMSAHTSVEEDKNKHYLEPDSIELGVINYLNQHFSNVILLVNTNNVMELGWVDNYENIKSVLWCPGAGSEAADAIVDVISGKVNPSGHLVDTIAFDALGSPAMKNMGDFQYTLNGKGINQYTVSYDENIYVGYKYYETRYFDKVMNQGNAGDFNYATEVQFPFGYGLSYTNFTWSEYTQKPMDANGNIEISVKVTNTGSVAGKDVVQIYYNAPYTDFDKTNHIEKSAASLVGYSKTKELAPNESEIVTIKVNKDELVTYDDVVNKTFILENGNYVFTAAKDVHQATNNFLLANGKSSLVGESQNNFTGTWTNTTLDKTTYAKDHNVDVTNRFETAMDIARDKYLTRNDWVGTFPKSRGSQEAKVTSSCSEVNGYQWQVELTEELKNKIEAKGTAEAANCPANYDQENAKKAYEFGQAGDKELIDVRGKNYEDVDWDELVKQMKPGEVGTIINVSGYRTAAATSIKKPKAVDLDGPAGLNNMATHEPYSLSYQAEVNIACTWNRDISLEHGRFVANDGLKGEYKGQTIRLASGWYGPAMNIHRTPFAGRNFEYYSEDSFMSGEMAYQAVKGAAEKGMYAFIKHFALNDQEDHRTGLCTWSNEQAIREIYLAPFKKCFEGETVKTTYYEQDPTTNEFVKKEGNTPMCTAVMSSFNRIGYTWSGGDYRLITQVLRNEWGFNGMVLTDYSQGSTSYMHTEQMIRAGGDCQLTQQGNAFNIKTDANKYYTQQAMKHVLFTVVNSNAMNGFIHGVDAKEQPFAYYILIEVALEILLAGGIATCSFFAVKRFRDEKKENAQ